jgi:hypothetical protein
LLPKIKVEIACLSNQVDKVIKAITSSARTGKMPESLCGFRVLVVLRGFYGNARNKACESNETYRYQMIAAPPNAQKVPILLPSPARNLQGFFHTPV